MQTSCDILIVGAGIAGLSLAISLAEKDHKLAICLVSKSALQETNTRLAQGGIAAVMSTENDSYNEHIEDTLNASQYKANSETVSYVVEHAKNGIHQLENWGVRFDQIQGNYHLGLEGGHSKARILHVKDQTGAAIHDKLIHKVKKHSSISVLEYCEVIELLLNIDEEASGAIIYNHENNITTQFRSKIVVLATGGLGQLFQNTTNSAIATGDGIALANAIGADITNIQAVQFHPTAFKELNKNQLFLISEAVRGAGAYIINKNGKRFLFAYDKRGELATRDVISSAIYQEMKHSGKEEVYLDCRHISKEILEHEFPYIIEKCRVGGYDLTKEPVPIIPAAHYSCGGIQVNMDGESSIKHLYAIGECANTGLHGNNRLASNSLLEAIVFTINVAENICSKSKKIVLKPLRPSQLSTSIQNSELDDLEEIYYQLKKRLTTYFITKKNKTDLLDLVDSIRFKIKDKSPNILSIIHLKRRLEILEFLVVNEAKKNKIF